MPLNYIRKMEKFLLILNYIIHENIKKNCLSMIIGRKMILLYWKKDSLVR